MTHQFAIPGSSFASVPEKPRDLDLGMGVAVALRTVLRPHETDFGHVADRVAEGNTALLPETDPIERMRLRNAIATGALITSGRHLQHGDAGQPDRNLELFTNCATAITSFAKFYLLLNGSGVGRSYDDELIITDWCNAPDLYLFLPRDHQDFPRGQEGLYRFAREFSLISLDIHLADFMRDERLQLHVQRGLDDILISAEESLPSDEAWHQQVIWHMVGDSREGWAKAVELLESLTANGTHRGQPLVLDFSDVRPAGSPIAGMQGRPASGPISLIRAFHNIRQQVIRDTRIPRMRPWEQAMLVDHILSVEVQVGGARRAARMATKSWRDPDILDFIRIKSKGGMWTANHSIMVDSEFWQGVKQDDLAGARAKEIFQEVTRCAYINGEPGFINGDKLTDYRTRSAWDKPLYEDGSDFCSRRYQATPYGAKLLAKLAERAATAAFPAITNPCGEIVLHVTGGYCTIADFAPLLACPVPFDSMPAGLASKSVTDEWDERVIDAVRLGVRFLIRVNRMDALYGKEVARTNRIGIGPTGLHEWAWLRFGLCFRDLINEDMSGEFWNFVGLLSDHAKAEANRYAASLGMSSPLTVTTIKPAGTTSKLWGLTEGAHLPARRQYLRWVQFKGTRTSPGKWEPGSDPLLAHYESLGYPVRQLRTFPGMSIVGFPTLPLLPRLGIGEWLTTASEATPEEQYRWLRLLEKYWIGENQGNQVSYTLKVYTDQVGLPAFRDLLLTHQPHIRCCSVLPTKPDRELGYEYLPEEEVSESVFAEIVAGIHDPELRQAIDLAHLQCASGACPI